jgi:hypothetical protein
MRENENGQGVIDGVETDQELYAKKVMAERARISELNDELLRHHGKQMAKLSSKETYRSISIMKAALAVLVGLQEFAEKSNDNGTIRIKSDELLKKCSVTITYKTPLIENNTWTGMQTNKKALIPPGGHEEPIEIVEFDELKSEGKL